MASGYCVKTVLRVLRKIARKARSLPYPLAKLKLDARPSQKGGSLIVYPAKALGEPFVNIEGESVVC